MNWWKRLGFAAGVGTIAGISLLMSGGVLVIKHMGWLQSLELRAYDRFLRVLPDQSPDPRLLIVTITESDIRQLERTTPTDGTLAEALERLQEQEPTVIGVDLYRNVPQETGQAELLAQMRSPNVIVITKLGNSEEDSIPPPPGIPAAQVGFNDLLVDNDGVIRRNLIFGGTAPSFSLLLALDYLADEGIAPRPSPEDENQMQLGEAIFAPLQANSGGYQGVDDRGYQVLLDYRASDIVARRVTLTQVLNGEVDSAWIRDKIVLIGTTAPSGKDLFYTPYSAGKEVNHQMSGVEIHAQMVSQILSAAMGERQLTRFWPEWAEAVWILTWAIVGSSVVWCLRNPILMGMGITSTLLLMVVANAWVFSHQIWVPVVAPAIATFISMSATITYTAQQARRQQKMVMTLLGQNTSPEIAEALWKNRDELLQSGKLPGQRLIATMLFTDIRGFSSISEQMSPESLLDLLNEYLEAMTQEIQDYQGIVNKFTGDGLLAVFGVPVPRTTPEAIAEDARRAVSCALSMGDRLQALNELWQVRGIKPIQMRIGIYTGPVVVGSLGGRSRMEYGVIGDSVNIAARLESCAKDRQVGVCRILIANETLLHIEDQFLVEPWGPMELRGKQQIVYVYRVLNRRPITETELSDRVIPLNTLSIPEKKSPKKLENSQQLKHQSDH